MIVTKVIIFWSENNDKKQEVLHYEILLNCINIYVDSFLKFCNKLSTTRARYKVLIKKGGVILKKIFGVANPDVPLSPAIQAGDFVFISGQVPTDPKTGKIVGKNIEEQTTAVIRKIEDLVKVSGGTLNDIVKTTVFLQDINLFSKMNEAYQKFFFQDQPARSCFRAELAIDALIEIEAVAYIPGK
mgnify:CR=1 FL=1